MTRYMNKYILMMLGCWVAGSLGIMIGGIGEWFAIIFFCSSCALLGTGAAQAEIDKEKRRNRQ